MSTDAATIPAKLARQLAGRCCYGACPDPALDGADYCGPHDAHEKGRDRTRHVRHRQRLADQGLCIVAGCGKKVGKRKRSDGTAMLRRCRGCAKADRDTKRARRRVTDDSRRVTVTSADPSSFKLEVGKDGATRTRKIFRAGQGGPSKEEIRKGHLRLRADSRGHSSVFDANYQPETLSNIESLPRVQRVEAISLLAIELVRALRLDAQVAVEVDPSLRDECLLCGRPHEADAE